MGRFLDKFPQVPYDINGGSYSNYERVTDITFRYSIVKDTLDNTAAYYEYVIKEDETPEILADRVYNDPQAYWIILYANNIYDPQYDWPMNSNTFEKYIIKKYGSITNAKSQIHHYEKLTARQVENSEIINLDRKIVDYNAATFLTCMIDNTTANISSSFVGQNVKQVNATTNNNLFIGELTNIDLPNNKLTLTTSSGKLTNYVNLVDTITEDILCRIVTNNQENLEFFINLPIEPQLTTYTINNKRVSEAISRTAVTNYEYEQQLNESKRNIKVIKKEYYSQIMGEFETLTKSNPTFYRKLA